MKFTRAIARKPGSNFENGLTQSNLGKPDFIDVLIQHSAYINALQKCGLKINLLKADLRYPDSTFVEDTAVLTPDCAILTLPGEDSRKGEVKAIRFAIEQYYSKIRTITPPGTLDGGDVCEVGDHFFIGLSERTNEEGGCQLAAFLAEEGYTASFIPVHKGSGILHLKSGMTFIGDNTLVVSQAIGQNEELNHYRIVQVDEDETYAANCVRINDTVLIPAGFPKIQAKLEHLGFQLMPLEMTEFQKMDGGLSCLSLRF